MTRNFLMTSTTIAALVAAPMAFATEDSASDLQGNSPAITETGLKNEVGSINADGTQKRYSIGGSEYDATTMTMSEAEYRALVASVGAYFETQDGKTLGVIEDLTFDGQGNPELIVDLVNDTKIDADTLVVTLLPDSVTLTDGKVLISTTEDELYLKAQSGSKRDDETRTTVIVM